eukprot:5895847-Pleurochrysis_carterae.AAC.1
MSDLPASSDLRHVPASPPADELLASIAFLKVPLKKALNTLLGLAKRLPLYARLPSLQARRSL